MFRRSADQGIQSPGPPSPPPAAGSSARREVVLSQSPALQSAVSSAHAHADPAHSGVEQPNIDLQISLSQRWVQTSRCVT